MEFRRTADCADVTDGDEVFEKAEVVSPSVAVPFDISVFIRVIRG